MRSQQLKPLSALIPRHASKIFVMSSAMQILTVLIIMAFVSYRESVKRAGFLANSNSKSIGLMLSTGDIFQLKNVVGSFVNEDTPFAWILGDKDQDLLRTADWIPERKIDLHRKFIVNYDGFFVLTRHELKYNDVLLGNLVLVNRVRILDWFLLSLILAAITSAFFFAQSKRLEWFSLQLGKSISDIVGFFNHSQSESALKIFSDSRRQSSYLEVETLAKEVGILLSKIIKTADIEKEAAIGRVIAQLSHDLRAPLAIFERLLVIPDDQIPSVRTSIKESLNRLNSMIETLRYTESEGIIKKSACILNFKSSLDILNGKALSERINVIHLGDTAVHLLVDSPKLDRALINLVSNAIDFARSEVRIETDSDSCDLVLRVIDDGPGVPENFLPKLFQRGATHGKHDGTGLGLAYVRQIMRGHGGDVTYRRENNMTVFECYLPNAVVEMSTVGEKNSQETPVTVEVSEPKQPGLKQVSICFKSAELNQRVFERLSGLSQSSYSFVLGFSQESGIVLTDSEDLTDQLPDTSIRPILMSSMLDDDIIRRAPTRLGIKG